MSQRPEFSNTDRLLVIAPHPDDESLGCGGLVQHALAAGATVRVIVVTDGDNNPWPQRRLEKIWHIDAAAQARWGSRRRTEAREAVAVLGLDSAQVEFLGWPDLGVTRRLLADGAAMVGDIAQRLTDFDPTWIATPTLADTHPDHSAIRLVLQAACLRSHCRGRVLGYGIHGDAVQADLRLPLSDAQLQRKREAVLCHRSQAAFGTARLLRFVHAQESFALEAKCKTAPVATWIWQLPLGAWPQRDLAHDLQIIGWTERGELRCAHLPAPPARRRHAFVTETGVDIEWRRHGRLGQLGMAALWSDAVVVYAKLARRGWPWLIFDDAGWSAAQASFLPESRFRHGQEGNLPIESSGPHGNGERDEYSGSGQGPIAGSHRVDR
jgi:LmbE family N-acetylglucosaminyl deacetylase